MGTMAGWETRRKKQAAKLLEPPRYATAIAVVYDTTCGHCNCYLPEHHSGKIRSELRFDTLPPTATFKGWAKSATAFPLDRQRGNGPMTPQAVKARAAVLAELIGVPLLDETDIEVKLEKK